MQTIFRANLMKGEKRNKYFRFNSSFMRTIYEDTAALKGLAGFIK